MTFTQFLYPNGTRKPQQIDRDPEIERMAAEIVARGYRFEIEVKPETQMVFMDILNDDRELTNRLIPNGPEIPAAVDEMVREGYRIVFAS